MSIEYCVSFLGVHGPAKEVARFRMENEREKHIDFCLLCPVPQRLFDEDEFLDWCCQEWGTPQHYDGCELVRCEPTVAHYVLSTACGPPVAWLKNVAPGYPNVHFLMSYKGYGVLQSGQCEKLNGSDCVVDQPDQTNSFNVARLRKENIKLRKKLITLKGATRKLWHNRAMHFASQIN